MKVQIGLLIIILIFHSLSLFGVKKRVLINNLEGLKK